MRKTAVVITLILGLLTSMGAITLQVGYCLPDSPKEYIYDDTSIYEIDGNDVNVTITINPPENKANNSIVAFTLKIFESFSARGIIVNPSDYFVSRETLDFYLVSGVILDYDRARAINSLWINWGNSLNKTHIEEEKSLYSNMYDVIFSKSGDVYFGSAVLPELSEGKHNVTVWVRAEQDQVTTYIPFWSAFSKTVTFTVDTIAPKILILTPENGSYKTPEALLNFTVNEPLSKIEYCLDGQSNTTIVGNTTLTRLPNGYHNVTVYATDKAGNTGSSETLFFDVDSPEPFPIMPVAAISSAIALIVAAAGLTVYHKKHKTKTISQ